MHETLCWVGSCRFKLETEHILERLFTQLAKHVVVGKQVVNNFLLCSLDDSATRIEEMSSLKERADASYNPVA